MQHTFPMEVTDYLERYPQTKHIDVYLNDINGIMRGKRLSVESMLTLEKGCYFPLSVYSMDQKGKIAARFMMNQTGCASPSPVPVPFCTRSAAQRADPADDERQRRPCPLEPRVILQTSWPASTSTGFPGDCPEIEFYLTGRKHGSAESGLLSYGYLDSTRGAV
jgi:gamma-glutamylputrescine synthase